MTDKNHNGNTTSLAAAQLEANTPESRPEHEDSTNDRVISEPTDLHVLPNLNNPFDLPNGKQVQRAYDHTTEKVLIVEDYEVGSKDKFKFGSDEHGTLRKRRVVCGCSCLPLIALLGIAAAVVVLVIALGAGLGVGLKKYVSREKHCRCFLILIDSGHIQYPCPHRLHPHPRHHQRHHLLHHRRYHIFLRRACSMGLAWP
jgi:hypothetical protein